jgi:hypothetical protein
MKVKGEIIKNINAPMVIARVKFPAVATRLASWHETSKF